MTIEGATVRHCEAHSRLNQQGFWRFSDLSAEAKSPLHVVCSKCALHAIARLCQEVQAKRQRHPVVSGTVTSSIVMPCSLPGSCPLGSCENSLGWNPHARCLVVYGRFPRIGVIAPVGGPLKGVLFCSAHTSLNGCIE